MTNTLNLKYNGLSHNCLQYAQVFRYKPFFTAQDVMVVFGHKAKNKVSRFTESLEVLVKYGLVSRVGGGYKITPAGRDYLFVLAKKRKKVYSDD